MPPVKSVRLDLQTIFSETADSGFNLYVVSGQGKLSSENTQKIKLVLGPPTPEQIAPSASPKVISQFLRDGLIQAARGVQAAATRNPPLQVKELKAEIEFIVRKEGSAELGFKFVALPIDAKLGGELASGAVQRIEVDFG